MPLALVPKVRPELPPYAGLLTTGLRTSFHSGLPEVSVILQAKPRPWAKPVTEAKLWELVRDMAGHLVTAEIAYRKIRYASKSPTTT